MSPEEKAIKLHNTFAIYLSANLMFDEEADEDAKQCALIAVDEIIQSLDKLFGTTKESAFYKEVKQEIEKL